MFYRGFHEGKGIWGLGELEYASGGFHIWPLGREECEWEEEVVEEPMMVGQTSFFFEVGPRMSDPPW